MPQAIEWIFVFGALVLMLATAWFLAPTMARFGATIWMVNSWSRNPGYVESFQRFVTICIRGWVVVVAFVMILQGLEQL
jgi:hypothetical protein